MAAVKYADPERALQAWMRDNDAFQEIAGERTYFGFPKNAIYPLYVVQLITSAPEADDSPILVAMMQIDCCAENDDRDTAALLRDVAMTEIESLEHGTGMGNYGRAVWGFVQSAVWMPEPAANRARFVLTVEIALIRVD